MKEIVLILQLFLNDGTLLSTHRVGGDELVFETQKQCAQVAILVQDMVHERYPKRTIMMTCLPVKKKDILLVQ